MSKEFDTVARDEIEQNISSLEKIDSDTSDLLTVFHMEKIQKNLHEIKGLAPMINQTNVSSIASLLYRIIEIYKEKEGNLEPKIVHESIIAMRSIFNDEIKKEERLEARLKKILNK